MGSFYETEVAQLTDDATTLETVNRNFLSGSASQATGNVGLSFFTAAYDVTITQVRMCTAGTAAAATPTLCRIGFYIVDSAGDLTLACACANDTALFAALNTVYTRDLSTGGGLPASYTFRAGQRYAGAHVVVSGAAVPTFFAISNMTAVLTAVAPRLAGLRSGQTDLPASITSGNITNSSVRVWVGGL